MAGIQFVTYQDNRSNGNSKWYARAVHPSTIDLDELADRIQKVCSMTKADVYGVLIQLVDVMNDELQNSNKVKLDGFGTFSIGLKTKPANTKEEFTAKDNIKGFRVNFLAEGTKQNGTLVRQFTNGITAMKASGEK